MSEFVVDRLEAIEVEQDHANAGVGRRRVFQLPRLLLELSDELLVLVLDAQQIDDGTRVPTVRERGVRDEGVALWHAGEERVGDVVRVVGDQVGGARSEQHAVTAVAEYNVPHAV